jgi:DNA modification methylase
VDPREGTLDEVVRGDASWCVVHGDALHVLRDLPDGCVHAFVTDPPYSSGGAFRGDRARDTTTKYVSTGSANKEIRTASTRIATHTSESFTRRCEN